nr:glycosyltransferase [Cryobacterium sp. Y29]
MVAEWRAMGTEVVTAASTASKLHPFTRIPSLSRGPSMRNLLAPQQIRRWIGAVRPDVILTNTATASAISRVSQLSIPVVYFCHGLHWNQGRTASDQMWKMIEAGLVSRTAGVITINQADEEWFSPRMRPEQLLRLRFGVGVPLQNYSQFSVVPDGRVRLLWVGEFTDRKQPHDAILVVKRLKELGVDCTLTMLGEGPLLQRVRDHVKDANLDSIVTLPGRADVQNYMQMATALVHTAKWEGLPRVMLEALACGRKSYAYDVKGVRDIPGARLVLEGSPHLLADAIRSDVEVNGMSKSFSFDRNLLDVRKSAAAIDHFVMSLIRARA